MRYHAKSEDGRLVGEGRTLGTAVKWAKKRGGDYVVDDSTGVVQWRRVAGRCRACRWVHEADSAAGTSYMGVELCPAHAVAPDLLAAAQAVLDAWTRASIGPVPVAVALRLRRAVEGSTKKES